MTETALVEPDPFDACEHATLDALQALDVLLSDDQLDELDNEPVEPVRVERAGVWTHLHRDDCPATLAVLDALLGGRVAAARWIGYVPTDVGARVDWDALVDSWLSTTETAVVHIAHGCAIAERHGGGLPDGIRWAVTDAIVAITTGR